MLALGIRPETNTFKRTTEKSHIVELDGLRGIAVAMVLVCHLYLQIQWGAWEIPWSRTILQFCHSGVDVFFVLSGFLIGRNLLAGNFSASFVKSFYLRRAFRILPVYWLLLLSFVVLPKIDAALQFGLQPYFTSEHPFWHYLFFLQNNTMAARQAWGADWLAVSWSLAVEEQFYLIAPWLVGLLSHRALVFSCILALFFCPLIRLGFFTGAHNIVAASYLLISKIDALGAGVLLAHILSDPARLAGLRRAKWLGPLALVFFAFYLIDPWTGDAVNISLFPSLCLVGTSAAIVYAVTRDRSLFAAFLRNRALTFLGGISFFVYLFHMPVQYVVHTAARASFPYGPPQIALTVLTGLFLTFSLGHLSRKYFEQPLIRLGRRLASPYSRAADAGRSA